MSVKGAMMSDGKLQQNPVAFLAVGVCFLGAGMAIGRPGGIGLIGVGVIFLILGVTQKRKQQSGESQGDDDNRPPA